jgi:peptidoglycan hydrolase-like protein with peptidoglycan-binding domain
VGFVGNTGNASGGQAHLHFEIRRNRVPADPYPRLTRTFSLSERMQSVAQALEKGASAQTSVSKFRTTFLDARAQSISIPSAIAALLDTQASPPASPPGAGTLAHDIEIVFGETNPKIITLQKFLINTQSGAAALHLKNSGATGYFGPVTKAALIEYQKATNIAATGIVDAATYAHIFVPEDEGDSSDIDDEDTAASIAFVFMRDLELGMKGEDVRALQKYLNAHGFIITQNGDGSPGYETTYFGALTRSALIRYQSQKGIAPAAGYFGPKTRASIF